MNSFCLFTPVALLGDVGGGELLVILSAVLVLFGGKGLPGIARNIGKISEQLRRGAQDFKDQLMEADAPPPVEPEDWTGTSTPHPTEEGPAPLLEGQNPESMAPYDTLPPEPPAPGPEIPPPEAPKETAPRDHAG